MKRESLSEVEENVSAKETLRKVDVDQHRQLLNRELEDTWRSGINDLCLIIGTDKSPMASTLYWLNTPMAHTLDTLRKKLDAAEKEFGTSDPAFGLLAEGRRILDQFQPHAEANAQLKERLKQQANAPKPPPAQKPQIPVASRESIANVKALLDDRSSVVRDRVAEKQRADITRLVDTYIDATHKDRSALKRRPEYRSIYPVLAKAAVPTSQTDLEKSPEADLVIAEAAAQRADIMAQEYVAKHVAKLSPILERMPALERLEVHAGQGRGALEGSITLSFDDNRSFVVRSQVVVSMSQSGQFFARYPTTFHNVVNSDGSKAGQMLSEAEMIDWAEGRSIDPEVTPSL